MHVAFSVMEDPTFRELILYICPIIKPLFIRTGNIIRKWILNEFKKQRIRVKGELTQVRSLIYASFDL
jgi:hypothetical protein